MFPSKSDDSPLNQARPHMGVAKIAQEGVRRFWSMFPLTTVLFWVPHVKQGLIGWSQGKCLQEAEEEGLEQASRGQTGRLGSARFNGRAVLKNASGRCFFLLFVAT